REHAQHLETADVRAKQQHAAVGAHLRVQFVQAKNSDIELAQVLAEQIDAIEDGRGETMDVAHDHPRRGGFAEHLGQVDMRSAPLRAATQEAIQGDRIQQHARAGAPAAQADVEDQPQGKAPAALAVLAPVLAHASSASPLARISALRSTRKRTCPAVTATCNSASSSGSSGARNLTAAIRVMTPQPS